MSTTTTRPLLGHDDTGGAGSLVLLLPGAGDLRSEYRFNAAPIAAAGYRVVTADLPGHGTSPAARRYSVCDAADALVALIAHLDAGPAVVVATSFAPAAAIWAGTDNPDAVRGIVAISPHIYPETSVRDRLTRAVIRGTLRGAWAPAMWAKLYAGWYKSAPPADLDSEIGKLRTMLAEPAQRRAVRETLVAHRKGMAARIERLGVPTLTIFGSADDHFGDPRRQAADTARALGGSHLVIEGAGHYPHVEAPATVTAAIISFLGRVA